LVKKKKIIKKKKENLKETSSKKDNLENKPSSDQKLEKGKEKDIKVTHTKVAENKSCKDKKSCVFSKKKDLITILILVILIIVIVLISVFTPANNDTNPPVDTNVPVDANLDTNTTIPTITQEEFQVKSLELQLKILREVKEKQTAFLETKYTELDLDAEQMDQCLLENDYADPDMNVLASDIIMKIQTDSFLATNLGVSGTPGIYVNGYFINGAQDYNFVSEKIEFALADPVIDWNYENKSYKSDIDSEPTLTILYNDRHQITKDNTTELIEFMKSSEQLTPEIKEFFNKLFSETEVVYLSYEDPFARDLIEAVGLTVIPGFYLDGNIEGLDIMTDENLSYFFTNLFVETSTNGYVLSPSVVSDLISAANITTLNQLLNYDIMVDELDYVMGDPEAKVNIYVFTDYDCPYCTKFEQETQSLVIENYVDANKANLVIKDFVVHEMSALFPAIFSRCAEKQGKYLETHELLFSLREQLGQKAMVDPVMEKYNDEIEELNKLYQQLLGQGQAQ
jgi:protein-disulfide isomerase